MNSLICFACVHSFCITYLTVFNSTHDFSHFYPSDSLPHPTRGEQASSCVVLSCQLGLNHSYSLGERCSFLHSGGNTPQIPSFPYPTSLLLTSDLCNVAFSHVELLHPALIVSVSHFYLLSGNADEKCTQLLIACTVFAHNTACLRKGQTFTSCSTARLT